MLYNSTPVRIEETVPDYFSGVVLQRNLSSPGSSPGNLKFQATFNLAVVWMLVFISLSKGNIVLCLNSAIKTFQTYFLSNLKTTKQRQMFLTPHFLPPIYLTLPIVVVPRANANNLVDILY